MGPQAPIRSSALVGLLVGLCVVPSTAWAQGVDTPAGLILTVARAQELVRETLDDSVAPIGTMLNQIGPSSVFATGEQGFGRWSLSLGVTASEFTVTNPDYTVADPRGDDQISGGIGSANLDLSLGVFAGYEPSATITTAGSVDLLFRLGVSLGDQDNLAEEIDLSSWAPILGAGMRIGLLKGPDIPAVSLSVGVNYFQRRLFTVQVEDTDDGTVNMDFDQTTTFLLLEVGKSFGWVTPYLVGGRTHNRLNADYVADIVFGSDGSGTAVIDDSVDIKQTVNTIFGGLEFGSGLVRIDLEAGRAGDESFARFFLRFSG